MDERATTRSDRKRSASGAVAAGARAPLAALVPLVLFGLFVRLWNADAPPLFMDEVHAIRAGLLDGFGRIWVTYGSADSSIPLTLWNRALALTVGIDELGIRLPGLLAGCALLVLVAGAARRALSAPTAILVTGTLAISPWLTYITREARPYPLFYALFAAAALGVFAWRRGAGRGVLVAATTAAALAIWFHPIALFSVGVLAVLPALALLAPGPRRRDAAIAALVFILLLAATVAPPMKELYFQLDIKKDVGRPDAAMVEGALLYLHGFPVQLPLLAFWAPLGLIGAVLALRRLPLEAGFGLAMLAVQIGAIFAIRPWLVEVPWIALRYVGHLLPFLLLLAVIPAGELLAVLARRAGRPAAGSAAALLLVVVAAGSHLVEGRYTLGRDGALNQHPEVMLIDDAAAPEVIAATARHPLLPPAPRDDILAAYRMIADDRAPGAVLEVPMSLMSPHLEWYRRIHGRRVIMGALDVGYWMPIFVEHPDALAMDTVIDATRLDREAMAGVRFVVLHLHPRAETITFAVNCDALPLYGRHLIPTLDNLGIWELEYGAVDDVAAPAWLDELGRVVHHGPWLKVYELPAPDEDP